MEFITLSIKQKNKRNRECKLPFIYSSIKKEVMEKLKTETELLELISNQLTGIYIILCFTMLAVFYIVYKKITE